MQSENTTMSDHGMKRRSVDIESTGGNRTITRKESIHGRIEVEGLSSVVPGVDDGTESKAKSGPSAKKKPKEQFTLDFSGIPLWLREGPYTYTAIIYFAVIIGVIIRVPYEYPHLFDSFPPPAAAMSMLPHGTTISRICAIYMIGVLVWMVKLAGIFPIVSYTMITWTLITLRHTARALELEGFWVEAIRFPSYVGATITNTVWWFVLVPILSMTLKSEKARRAFYKFNFAPFLLNVHLLNWGFAVLDHALDPRQLTKADLYIGKVVGVCYLLFYLAALDRHGHHFYIILTPRTHFCIVPYTLILVLYAAIWNHWPFFEILEP